MTPTKPGSASLPFFGIEPAIIDPISGQEIYGNDVEGVLAIKKPWPSMARTVWGAHARYMDTYLNVYKGYYVSEDPLHSRTLLIQVSSPVTGPVGIMRDITGFEAAWTTWSTYPGTGSPRRKLRQPSLNTVNMRRPCSTVHFTEVLQIKLRKPLLSASTMSSRAKPSTPLWL